MNWLRRVLNHFGLARDVAKPPDPLIERADKVIDNDELELRLQVVTRREARLRGLDFQAETRTGVRRKR